MAVISDDAIRRAIARAELLFDTYGEALLQMPGLGALLDAYRQGIRETGEFMNGNGVVAACSVCAQKPMGSCCFRGIEEGYDPILLLVNRLMGIELPKEREISESCFFLGPCGCRLSARYYFCVQYLCSGLQELLGQERSRELLAIVGEELFAGWKVEQAIRKWLSARGA